MEHHQEDKNQSDQKEEEFKETELLAPVSGSGLQPFSFSLPSLPEKDDLAYQTPIKKIRPRHYAIARMVARGIRFKEIRQIFNITQPTIQRIIKTPILQQDIKSYHERMQEETIQGEKALSGLVGLAIEEIESQLIDTDLGDAAQNRRTRTAFEVLDRTGYGKTSQRQVTIQDNREYNTNVTVKEIMNDVLALVNIEE